MQELEWEYLVGDHFQQTTDGDDNYKQEKLSLFSQPPKDTASEGEVGMIENMWVNTKRVDLYRGINKAMHQVTTEMHIREMVVLRWLRSMGSSREKIEYKEDDAAASDAPSSP